VTVRRKSGPSGGHKSPRRKLSQSAERFWLQDKVSESKGQTWAEWARIELERAAQAYADGHYIRALDPADD
jgi:hypothetical protein